MKSQAILSTANYAPQCKPLGKKIAHSWYLCSLALAILVVVHPSASGQTFTTVHEFMGGTNDGANPFYGSLIQDKAGNLYGVTSKGGGAPCYCGIVFQSNDSGKLNVLYRFTGADGASPYGRLIRDSVGNFYGTTYLGGHLTCGFLAGPGCGTVFKLDISGKETVLYRFANKADGAGPAAGLVRDGAGNLYGTTTVGGDFSCNFPEFFMYGCGTVFKLNAVGKLTVLHTFTGMSDGATPVGGLIRDAAGNLFGTAALGGNSACANGCGTVFEIDAAGTFTVIHTFAGVPDGMYPVSGLIRDLAGNLYGTTSQGGDSGSGTVYKVDSSGNETVLHSFDGIDGAFPVASVIRDKSNNLFGTARFGGDTSSSCSGLREPGCGTAFMLDTNGNLTVLHTFHGKAEGAVPYTGLILSPAGDFDGMTYEDGTYGYQNGHGIGTVFKIHR